MGTHMCRHRQHTQGGVHRGAGWWRDPRVSVPGWPHQVSLIHPSSHLCSPQSPVTSPLCVSQVAQQVSYSQCFLIHRPSTGWLDADGQVWTGRSRGGGDTLATSQSWSQRSLGRWITSFLYEKQLSPFSFLPLPDLCVRDCGSGVRWGV